MPTLLLTRLLQVPLVSDDDELMTMMSDDPRVTEWARLGEGKGHLAIVKAKVERRYP